MAAELYIVPKIPRTTRKLRPYISISRQIDNLLPKPKIPFSSHPAYLDMHLDIHDDSETLDTDAAWASIAAKYLKQRFESNTILVLLS